jgi:hypothetical protein
MVAVPPAIAPNIAAVPPAIASPAGGATVVPVPVDGAQSHSKVPPVTLTDAEKSIGSIEYEVSPISEGAISSLL